MHNIGRKYVCDDRITKEIFLQAFTCNIVIIKSIFKKKSVLQSLN